ncbi:MAG: hypothetical protein HY779_06410 [Rubrobacteridae bacterium]|nr:hypothetical protein [Rubrobacteridae bacterium]
MGKPTIKKKYLFVISGLLWTIVGLMLLKFAYTWLINVGEGQCLFFGLLGVGLGVVISVFGLSRIAQKNIKRINLLPENPCLFAFQAPKNYLIIGFMIFLGVFLRSHSFVPKPFLAIFYIGMGTGLMFASISYFSELRRKHSPHHC